MLIDVKIKQLKNKEKNYKIAGFGYARKFGDIRYDYRINNRCETLTIGRYRPEGINLVEARGKLAEAKKIITAGISPVIKTAGKAGGD